MVYRVWNIVTQFSLLLLGGAVLALVWANTAPDSYHHFVEFVIWDHAPIGHLHLDAEGHAHRTLTLHYLINDILMAFFFAVAGKEVWEAIILRHMTPWWTAGRSRRRRTSRFPIWSAGSCSARATRRCGSCCCWRLPTTRAG